MLKANIYPVESEVHQWSSLASGVASRSSGVAESNVKYIIDNCPNNSDSVVVFVEDYNQVWFLWYMSV
jgi:hypothetical protein